MTGKVTLKDVRLTFPQLWEAKAREAGKPAKFSASFVFGKDHPQKAELERVMVEVAKAKWGEAKYMDVLKALKATDKLAVHDGDAKNQYQGYAGNLYVNASNSVRPLIIGGGPDGKAPLTANDGKPYSGCYVNAIIEVWAQDHPQHGKRINASLMGVQFLRDGERLSGGATAAADDFEAIPQEAATAAAASGQGAASLF